MGDLEFKYNFGSNLTPQGSGSAFRRRDASAKPILAKFQLKRNHSDPSHAQNSGFLCNWFLLGGAKLLRNLCNEPLKGYPRIKKRQKIGPDHIILPSEQKTKIKHRR